MSDYIANSLIVLVICAATLVCGIGISKTLSTSAKAETMNINQSMEQLEKLYNELYTFHKSRAFHINGFGTQGSGDWIDRFKVLNRNSKLKAYTNSLVPEPVEHEFLYDQPLEPNHLWYIGKYYMNNAGAENKSTLAVKAAFEKLFKLHKSRKK